MWRDLLIDARRGEWVHASVDLISNATAGNFYIALHDISAGHLIMRARGYPLAPDDVSGVQLLHAVATGCHDDVLEARRIAMLSPSSLLTAPIAQRDKFTDDADGLDILFTRLQEDSVLVDRQYLQLLQLKMDTNLIDVGLFPLVSLLNHSCMHNCAGTRWDTMQDLNLTTTAWESSLDSGSQSEFSACPDEDDASPNENVAGAAGLYDASISDDEHQKSSMLLQCKRRREQSSVVNDGATGIELEELAASEENAHSSLEHGRSQIGENDNLHEHPVDDAVDSEANYQWFAVSTITDICKGTSVDLNTS